MPLTLLQEGISLKDQEKLGNKKCWLYYYYIMANRKIEKEEMDKLMDKKQPQMQFPDDFVSNLQLKIAQEDV